jgi:PAP2 superfamily C-terminal
MHVENYHHMLLPLAIAPVRVITARVVVVILSLALWYLTQSLLGRRKTGKIAEGTIIWDGIHELTARFNRRLLDNPRRADALLIASSLVIDLLGMWVVGVSILGSTLQPFVGLFMLFGLRQICQAFCPLPPPVGMIWRDPGCPTLLVTYGTTNDLFFSGHTAIAVFGVLCLSTSLGPAGVTLGILIAAFEISAVLILRAHYTMDVFTGAITALYVHHLSWVIGPHVDSWIGRVVHG